jgi:hypothetical protein
MPRISGNRGGGGRFRVTDDTVVTVADLQVRAEHVTALLAYWDILQTYITNMSANGLR